MRGVVNGYYYALNVTFDPSCEASTSSIKVLLATHQEMHMNEGHDETHMQQIARNFGWILHLTAKALSNCTDLDELNASLNTTSQDFMTLDHFDWYPNETSANNETLQVNGDYDYSVALDRIAFRLSQPNVNYYQVGRRVGLQSRLHNSNQYNGSYLANMLLSTALMLAFLAVHLF
jgi:hypothetical protein